MSNIYDKQLSNWGKKFESLLIFGISFLGYYFSLLPNVGQGDTAKFQFVGYVLGTPHATGYPLYILLNFLFTHLFPFGSLAFKANLLSAIYASLSLVFTYHILLILNFNRSISISSCLVFGFTYTLWSQSIIAEVYTLNLLFVVLVTKYLILWHQSLLNKHLFLALGFYAFSFGNHLTMITMLPAIFILILQTDKTIFVKYKIISFIFLMVCLGILQYSYLFIVYYSPRKTYVEMATPDLKTLLWYVTGAQFKNRMFAYTFHQFIYEQIPMYFRLVKNEFHFLLPLFLIGLWNIKKSKLLLFIVLVFLGNLFYALNYAIGDIFVYFIPSYFIITLVIAAGLSALWKHLIRWYPLKIISYVLIFIFPVWFFFTNYSKISLRTHFQEKIFVETIINKVGKNSLIVSAENYEISETFWYYFIGLGIEEKRNIFLNFHFDPEAIQKYVYKKAPLYLPEERVQVPYGLSVYCLDSKVAEKLRQKGLTLFQISDYLFQIS